MSNTATIVTAEENVQMGVTVTLTGQDYWFTYLQELVADAEIDEETRDEWERKYDGYEMTWTFNNPVVAQGDGNIDAACIEGIDGTDKYSDGGWCVGIKYEGSFSSQPDLWAVWFTAQEMTDFTASVGFDLSYDDTDNWRTEATSFTVTWEVMRWLPKEERSVDYYDNEYRFSAGMKVKPYTY